MVLRNVAKTFSLEEQRQEINEIAVDLDAVNTTLTNWNAAQWDTAYSWGDHAQAGYWVDNATSRSNWDTAYGWGDHGTVGYWVEDSVKITNWDTAYGWGDHGAAGYLVATAASYNNTNWDTSYSWGDHALAGYLTSYTETDPVFGASAASGIAAGDITNWDTAYGWGDHGTAGYAASGDIPNPGGTSAGAGTALDPFIGSLQFNGGSNTFGGDSLLVWNNTDNYLGVGTSSPLKRVHLASAGDVHLALQDTNANTNTQIWEMSVGQNTSGQSEYVLRSRDDDGTGGNERLRVTWGGQLITQGNNVNDFDGVIYAPGDYSLFGNIVAGKVPDSANNNTGYVLLHQLGQNQGMQFAGNIISNSYTGSAFIHCHFTVRYNDDAISYVVHNTSSPGIAKVNIFLTTVTYNGDTWLTLRKNGGGTGVMYLDGFYSGNANNAGFGGLREVIPSAITSPTDIIQLNP